jgi:hypothetical protein
MKVSDLFGPIPYVCLLPLPTVPAYGQAVPQGYSSVPTAQAEAMVASFYREVVARQPIAYMGDPNVFRPYFSKALLQRFDDNAACFADWGRQNPGTTDKPPFGQLEMGVYSGSDERSHPRTFHIERTESAVDGSSRVYVKLTYAEPTFKLLWHVAALVVRENGRPVVDDVIYLADTDHDEARLSEILLGRAARGLTTADPLTTAPQVHHEHPRAVTAQTSTTVSPATTKYRSYKFTVGSQCGGIKVTRAPSPGSPSPISAPCSSPMKA